MELVCACVNLKLRPSPLAWVTIDSKKQGVEWNLEQRQLYPNVFPDPSHGEGEVMTSPEVTWR